MLSECNENSLTDEGEGPMRVTDSNLPPHIDNFPFDNINPFQIDEETSDGETTKSKLIDLSKVSLNTNPDQHSLTNNEENLSLKNLSISNTNAGDKAK